MGAGLEDNEFKIQMKSARGFALGIYLEIIDRKLYANLEVPKQLNLPNFSSGDKSRVTDLVHGTFRWQLFLKTVIEIAAKRSKDEIEDKLLKLLEMASYEILFGKTTKEILVSEWVNEAKKILGIKYSGFTNAVLRRVSERNFEEWQQEIDKAYPGRLDLIWSCPAWIIEKFQKVTKSESELIKLLAANNQPPTLWKVNKTLKPNNFALAPTAEKLNSGEIEFDKNIEKAVPRVQDAASQAAAFLFANYLVDQNETDWLDTCAAPGGKTATMAQVAPISQIKITAVDIHPHKEKLIKHNIREFKNVEVLVGDSRLSPWKNKKFDRILIDAPCTGLGAIRRRSESRWQKKPIDVKDLVTNAKEIFHAAMNSIKPGGFIEYVVCSPILEETDDFVKWAMATYSNLEISSPGEYLSVFQSSDPLELVEVSEVGLRFWPQLHESDAMFVCLFKIKNGN